MSDTELPLLARQPILDHNLQVIGYELLCRPLPRDDEQWQEENGDFATSEVVIGAYQELGFEKVTGGLPAFINFTRNWLFNPPLVSANILVAEILEYIHADEDTVRAIEKLRRLKYQVALDDFIGEPHQVELLPYVDIVKVDLMHLHQTSDLSALIQQHQRPGLTWLAEKVETPEEYEICREAGCTLFQGYFFAKPMPMYGKRIPDNKLTVLQLLTTLSDPEVEIEDITHLLQTEPQLSFRLLQLINSAATGIQKEVTSISQAIMLAGINRIKTWANVLALGKLSDKPAVLREQAVIRGLMMQHLAQQQIEQAKSDSTLDINTAFTLGLFSVLDAFLDLPMREVCERLKLPEELSLALLHHKGQYGALLKLTIGNEQADWKNQDWQKHVTSGLSPESVVAAFQKAIQDSRELLKES